MTVTQLTLFSVPVKAPTGFVYVGTAGGLIKAGYTTNLVRRGGQLKLNMLYTFPGSVEDEQRLHRLWARHREPGNEEWYRPARVIFEWLDERVPQCTVARMHLRMLMFQQREAA